MGSGWRRAKLVDVAAKKRWALNGGPFGSKLSRKHYSESGVPVIRGTNLPADSKFSFDDFVFVTEEKADELQANNAQPGDLVFTQRGTIGQVGLIPTGAPFRRFVISQSQMKLTVDPAVADALFLYYFFSAGDTVQKIRNLAFAAGVPHINLDILRNFEVPLPPLPVQRRIAAILSAYDELIENGQRRIRILEAMARALYREWFVHFRFPGHENHPRVPSPLGGIPKGWGVASLDEVKAEQPHAIDGGPFGSKLGRKDYVAEGVPVIRGSNLSESGRFDPTSFAFVSDQKADDLRANLARPGDIVVTQRGTLGQIGMIPPGTAKDRFVISQSQMKITLNPEKVIREYVFFFLRSDDARQRIKNLASSSGVPHINLAVLREFQILLPPIELQRRFGRFALGTEAAIEVLQGRIRTLRRTRDLLLPRLLSGQIELEVA